MFLSKIYSAVLVTGPRQPGKTVMLEKLAEKDKKGCKYSTLDDLDSRKTAKNDPSMS